MSNYNNLKNELILCDFCFKSCGLPNFKKHLKSKSCRNFQTKYKSIYGENEFEKSLFKLEQNLNKLKSEILN